MPRNAASSRSTAPRRATAASWKPGQSGNPKGRPPAPVDISALARRYGPRCIEVAAELLNSPDDRIRLATVVALLDRGFGRPTQMIATSDGSNPALLHLLAAQAVSVQLAPDLERRGPQPLAIDGKAELMTYDPLTAPPPTE